MLRDAFPGTRIEVINAAVPGTNSNVLQVMASYFSELEPDVVLLYMGNNESNPPFASPALSKILPFISRPMLFRAEVALNRLRLVQAARSRRHDQAPPLVWPSEDTPDNLALNDFEANLEIILREARGAGAKLLLCTLGRNATDNPAAQTVADITAIPRSSFNRRILSFAQRAPADLLRLLDVDRACWEYSGEVSPPGDDLFCDPLHFTFEGNYLLAATIFPHTATILEERGCRPAGTAPISQAECERRMGLGPARKLSLVEPDPATGRPFSEPALAEAHTARLRQQAGVNPPQSIELDFQTALRLNPDDRVLRVQYLRWLLESGDIQSSLRESTELIKRFPKSRAANRLLARTLERGGDMEGARRAYVDTLTLYPDDGLSMHALKHLGPMAPGPENGS
jgi:tetratricopeptide (TPR) repeat protein